MTVFIVPASMGRCAINPDSGFGWYEDRHPYPEGSRKVLVVGGGVGRTSGSSYRVKARTQGDASGKNRGTGRHH